MHLAMTRSDVSPPIRPLGPLGTVVLAILLAWTLASMIPDFRRVVEPLGSVGFYANNDGLVYDDDGPFQDKQQAPGWRAGIREGDRIDLKAMACTNVGSAECGAILSVLGGFEYFLPGATVTIRLAPGAASDARAFTLTAEPLQTHFVFRAVMLLDVAAGIAIVLAAAWLVWTRPGPMSWGFFLYVLWFNPSQGFVFYAYLQQWPQALLTQYLLEGLVQGAGLAGLLLFAIRAPNDRIDLNWRWLERILPVIAVALGLLIALSNFTAFGFHTELITRAGILSGIVVDLAAIGILLARRKSLAPEDNQRLRWVMWGCLIGLPAFIFAEIAQGTTLLETRWGDFTPNDTAIGLLYLANGVLCLFVFEAVRRQRVVNVSIPLRRVTILGLSLSVPALLLHEAASSIQENLDLSGWSWLGIGAIVAYLISRIHESAVETAERFFNRHLDRIGEELESAIASAGTFAEVDQHLAQSASHHLHLTSAATFRRQGAFFERHTEGLGWDETATRRLPETASLLAPVIAKHKIADLAADPADEFGLPRGLKRPIVGAPSIIRGRVLAVALYGPHHSGADLDSNERQLLARLADCAADAYVEIENAELKKRIAALENSRPSHPTPTPPHQGEGKGV